jgi:hypothetical protein
LTSNSANDWAVAHDRPDAIMEKPSQQDSWHGRWAMNVLRSFFALLLKIGAIGVVLGMVLGFWLWTPNGPAGFSVCPAGPTAPVPTAGP